MRRWMVVACACAGCGPLVSDEGDGSASNGAGTSTSPTTTMTTSMTSTVSSAVESGPIDSGEVDVDDGSSFDTGAKLDFGGVMDTGECEYYWASQGCAELSEFNAFGSAETPVGGIGVQYAYFVSQTGCGGCVDANVAAIYITPSPTENLDYSMLQDGLILDIALSDPFYGPFGEPQVANRIAAFLDGDGAETFGATFVLEALPGTQQLADPFDPNDAAIVSGTIDYDADGWSVHLSFDARYCPAANFSYICE